MKLTPDGIAPIEGTVDHLSKDFIGALSDDAIYRFIHGFIGPMMVGHHIFAEGADKQELEAEWQGWLHPGVRVFLQRRRRVGLD